MCVYQQIVIIKLNNSDVIVPAFLIKNKDRVQHLWHIPVDSHKRSHYFTAAANNLSYGLVNG